MSHGKLISQSELYEQNYLASDSTPRDHCSTMKWRKFKLRWLEVKNEAKKNVSEVQIILLGIQNPISRQSLYM